MLRASERKKEGERWRNQQNSKTTYYCEKGEMNTGRNRERRGRQIYGENERYREEEREIERERERQRGVEIEIEKN